MLTKTGHDFAQTAATSTTTAPIARMLPTRALLSRSVWKGEWLVEIIHIK